jgi:hypothetical protein
LDKFPEAFERFESDVDIGRFGSYHELTLAFRWWAGERWRGTSRQWEALNIEAENLGFEVPDFVREELGESNSHKGRRVIWRLEKIALRGGYGTRYRDLRTGRFIKKP